MKFFSRRNLKRKKLLIILACLLILCWVGLLWNYLKTKNSVIIVRSLETLDKYSKLVGHSGRRELKLKRREEWSRQGRMYGFDGDLVRDFFSYECKNMLRIGAEYVAAHAKVNKTWRIDGAWFLCTDDRLAIKKNDCNVLSFGIGDDFSFDEEIAFTYGCRIHSFDPFIETDYFARIRDENPKWSANVSLDVIENVWTFHRIGIETLAMESAKPNTLPWMLSYPSILNHLHLENKVDI